MLSEKYVRELISAIRKSLPEQERARMVIRTLAGERIATEQPHRNRLIFMARQAVDSFQIR